MTSKFHRLSLDWQMDRENYNILLVNAKPTKFEMCLHGVTSLLEVKEMNQGHLDLMKHNTNTKDCRRMSRKMAFLERRKRKRLKTP